MNGALIIDKPAGLTSHDVVNRVRRIIGQRSVGHLGTLDPLATGVLPLLLGNLTRLSQFYSASEKEYEGVMRLGFATTTYDAAGERVGEIRVVSVSREQLLEACAHFRGVIEQTPPAFSAKKIDGVPAYKLARKDRPVELKPVQVEIKELEIGEFADDRIQFRARVSSGTYLRSVAHDLGARLGCGGHLESLRRTAVAEFTLGDSHTLDRLAEAAARDEVDDLLVHPRKLLPGMPSISATEEQAARIRSGRSVNLPEMSRAREVKVFVGQGELIAVATRVAGTLFHAKIVLAGEEARVR